MTFTTAKVMVVDDHPVLRRGVEVSLAMNPRLVIVEGAASPRSALPRIEQVRPDLVILDLMFPGESGLKLLQEIRSRVPGVKVLVLSAHDELVYGERALAYGASGYVMKHEAVHILDDAVRTVLNGETWLGERLKKRLAARDHPLPAADPLATLTGRELEVLHLIGQGFSTRQIAERSSRSIKTIETYRARIKKKLDLDSAADLIRYAVSWTTRR